MGHTQNLFFVASNCSLDQRLRRAPANAASFIKQNFSGDESRFFLSHNRVSNVKSGEIIPARATRPNGVVFDQMRRGTEIHPVAPLAEKKVREMAFSLRVLRK